MELKATSTLTGEKHYLASGHTFVRLGYAVALDLFLIIAI